MHNLVWCLIAFLLGIRESYLVKVLSDITSTKREFHQEHPGKLIEDLGDLLVKLLRCPTELQSTLSALCDVADDADESEITNQIFASDHFMKALVSIISEYEHKRQHELHHSFHMCLYLLLGLVSDRQHFHRFLQFTEKEHVFENIIARMPSLLANEIQV